VHKTESFFAWLLSGTGSDGASGFVSYQGTERVTIAQSPDDAGNTDGMHQRYRYWQWFGFCILRWLRCRQKLMLSYGKNKR